MIRAVFKPAVGSEIPDNTHAKPIQYHKLNLLENLSDVEVSQPPLVMRIMLNHVVSHDVEDVPEVIVH